jgi:hypothetical protein
MFQVANDLAKHAGEFRRALSNNKYEVSPEGIYFPAAHALAAGMYVHDVNGLDEQFDPNLLPTEGLVHILNVVLGSTAKAAAFYLALYAGAVAPASSWTAANVTANSTEITSGSEGYSESVRQTLTVVDATTASITNAAAKAAFTIITATSLTVNGCFLASASAKGATSGVLLSASRFASARSLSNADVFNLGYTVSLTSS